MIPPPLFISRKPTPQMPAMRTVNPDAVAYLSQTGRSIDDVYPDDVAVLRRMAPPSGGPAATAFAFASGLPASDVYPAQFSGEAPSQAIVKPKTKRDWKRWAGAGLGIAAGGGAAVLVGPLALLAGATLGGVVDVLRHRHAAKLAAVHIPTPPAPGRFIPHVPPPKKSPSKPAVTRNTGAGQPDAAGALLIARIKAAVDAKNRRILGEDRANAMRAAAAHLTLLATKPPLSGGPGAMGDWLRRTGLDPVTTYPELGWVATKDPAHPETAWRAGYDVQGGPSDGDWVHWWSNHDGGWGWAEGSGGINVGRSLSQLIDTTSNVVGTFQTVIHATLNNPVMNVIPWSLVADGLEAATSTVPVLGTAVSDIVATGEVALNVLQGGNILEQAIRAAYDYAMASAPGAAALRPILDPSVNFVIHLSVKGEPVQKAAVNAFLDEVSATPEIGGLSPRSVSASLVAIVVGKLGIKP